MGHSQRAKQAILPHTVNEEWMFVVYIWTIELMMGPRADMEFTHLQFHDKKESVNSRGKQQRPETGDR